MSGNRKSSLNWIPRWINGRIVYLIIVRLLLLRPNRKSSAEPIFQCGGTQQTLMRPSFPSQLLSILLFIISRYRYTDHSLWSGRRCHVHRLQCAPVPLDQLLTYSKLPCRGEWRCSPLAMWVVHPDNEYYNWWSRQMAAFAAALVLLLAHWVHQQSDSTFDSKVTMDLVRKLFLSLRDGERKCHMAGRFV